MVTLDLIQPSGIEIGESVVQNAETATQGNMIIPIVVCLVIVAIVVVIVSKTIISKELKNAK